MDAIKGQTGRASSFIEFNLSSKIGSSIFSAFFRFRLREVISGANILYYILTYSNPEGAGILTAVGRGEACG
jgi:hypothetical protein